MHIFKTIYVSAMILFLYIFVIYQRIVTAKIRLSRCRNTMQTTKTTCYDWPLLNKRDISNKYITLRNKFNDFLKISKIL